MIGLFQNPQVKFNTSVNNILAFNQTMHRWQKLVIEGNKGFEHSNVFKSVQGNQSGF